MSLSSITKRATHLIRKFFLTRKGYSSYYVSNFSKLLKDAYRKSPLPRNEKKWAYKRGFFPWRIQQYGLNENNYKSIISDEDYLYLYPLNNNYRKWIDDKLTFRYVLAPFQKYVPEYYFHLVKERGIMRLMDCPEEFDSTIDGLIALLKAKKLLAMKPTAGEKGVGFFKLESVEDGFLVNGEQKTQDEMKEFFSTLSDHIVTEYVDAHPLLNRINPYSVNTLRVMVINEHGNDPIIPFVYMRVGTKQSGTVDNVSQGGMVCKVDVETGRFYDAETLNNHVYHKVINHPDTNEPLEGILPHWELIKNTIIQISSYIPQLRWLGFDVAITTDGFKIVEVNSHQGLHKANEYPPEVNRFLFSELEKKKRKYGRK